MDATSVTLLALGGVGAGLTGSIAGMASLVSYPALLAAGLPPLAANVTNTTAMLSNTVGTAAGSRAELRGQGRRVLRLSVLAACGGALGALLLLSAPAETFERVVPFLIAFAGITLLARDRLQRALERRTGGDHGRWLPAGVVAVGLYGGYFGAAAGVLMLAVLSLSTTEPLPVTNAVKNLVTGAANVTAAVGYAFLAPVHWPEAAVLAVGCALGSWAGPAVVRRVPEAPLRIAIGVAALVFALALARG